MCPIVGGATGIPEAAGLTMPPGPGAEPVDEGECQDLGVGIESVKAFMFAIAVFALFVQYLCWASSLMSILILSSLNIHYYKHTLELNLVQKTFWSPFLVLFMR